MNKINLKAYAKINLNLLVLNKRNDNYHNIKSIFQKVTLYDEILIEKNKTNTINIKTNIDSLNNENNIIYKAYQIIKEKYPNISGLNVLINKKIPMQAGLGGGSTDCASFIIGINKLLELNMTPKEIISISSSLGADVVPCLYNNPLFAEGIGNEITPLESNCTFNILIIKPVINCSTKEMYNLIDQSKIKNSDTTIEIIKGLKENNIELISNNLYNTFEKVINDPTISTIKKDLIENGALNSLMTGSGSCIYGIFKNKQQAKKAYNRLKEKYEVYLCESYNPKGSEFYD